ncbi:MAG: ATP synthase F1 subunit epsilon [Rhodospirillales bacterium]|nr:ATP synthase F1 subunit epsilon [Rhodospirillales bacterium]USO07154.1 MAG: ATP synthase F1 subunit epsilon [Rhodospirillales bacterium]
MAGLFTFELISPEEKLISEDVAMVTVPGEEGEFGVLAGHSPLLSPVRPGVVHIYKTAANENPRRVFVAGGFADVGPDHCTVLAEEAHDLAFVDVHALEADIHELTGLVAAVGEAERPAIEKRLTIARAKRAAL